MKPRKKTPTPHLRNRSAPQKQATRHRGYGKAHKELRAYWDKKIKAGTQPACSRCGYPVQATDTWDLDHTDDRSGYLGPAHAHCNRSAGADKVNKKRNAPPPRANRTTRDW